MNLALPELDQPVRLRFARPMTDAELMRFSAENSPLRVERDANGELIVMSPTGSEGGGIEGDVFGELRNWALEDRRGKAFGPNAGFRLADGSVRAADAAWLSLDRWQALTQDEREGFAPLCPEFVIEVRSRTDRLPELQEKMLSWTDNGAELGWLVDPLRRVVEIYRAGGTTEMLGAGVSTVFGEGPVSGFALELSRVW